MLPSAEGASALFVHGDELVCHDDVITASPMGLLACYILAAFAARC
jgi:hypothetical protein